MLVPVINFPGTCAKAHELYKKAFKMTVDSVDHYHEAPPGSFDEPLTEETRNLIMHSECTIYGTRVNMSDDTGLTAASGNFNIFLPSEDDVRKAFDVLKEGGIVGDEPGPVFWTSLHCSLQDRFGVSWQIMTE